MNTNNTPAPANPLATTSIDFGNKLAKITITGATEWTSNNNNGGGENSRIYYEIAQNVEVISKMYRLVHGTTRDDFVKIGADTFGYVAGFCGSKTKRAAVEEAVKALAAQLV